MFVNQFAMAFKRIFTFNIRTLLLPRISSLTSQIKEKPIQVKKRKKNYHNHCLPTYVFAEKNPIFTIKHGGLAPVIKNFVRGMKNSSKLIVDASKNATPKSTSTILGPTSYKDFSPKKDLQQTSGKVVDNYKGTEKSSTKLLNDPTKEIIKPLEEQLKERYPTSVIVPYKGKTEENSFNAENKIEVYRSVSWKPVMTTSVSTYVVSPFKPVSMPQKYFHEYFLWMFLYKCLRAGLPENQILIYATLMEGNTGENCSSISRLIKKILHEASAENKNFLPFIRSEDKQWLSEEAANSLQNPRDARQLMFLHEMQIPFLMQKYFKNQEVILNFDRYFPREAFNFYNNTPNVNPDCQIIVNHGNLVKYFDIKMTGTNRFWNKDIIQAVPNNISLTTLNAQHHMEKQIRTRLRDSNLNRTDKDKAEFFMQQLQTNRKLFDENHDVTTLVSTFNSFHETYEEFILKQRIGMNLQLSFSVNDYKFHPLVKEKLDHIYDECKYSPDCELNHKLESFNYTENTTLEEHLENLRKFWESFN